MTLERLGSALLITAACAGIAASAQGRGAPPAAPQGGAPPRLQPLRRKAAVRIPTSRKRSRRSPCRGRQSTSIFAAVSSRTAPDCTTTRSSWPTGASSSPNAAPSSTAGFHFPTTARVERAWNVIMMFKGDAGYMTEADEAGDARSVPEAGRRAGQHPRHAVRGRSAVRPTSWAGPRRRRARTPRPARSPYTVTDKAKPDHGGDPRTSPSQTRRSS